MKKLALTFASAAAVAILDQIVKSYIRSMPLGERIAEIPGFVQIIHSMNTGAAFSILSGQTILLAVLSLVLLAGMSVYIFTQMNLTKSAFAAMGCLIGGGLGNLIDRVLFAGVTDYLRLLFFDFPVFNLADIAITVSIAWLMLLLFMGKLEEITGENNGSDH